MELQKQNKVIPLFGYRGARGDLYPLAIRELEVRKWLIEWLGRDPRSKWLYQNPAKDSYLAIFKVWLRNELIWLSSRWCNAQRLWRSKMFIPPFSKVTLLAIRKVEIRSLVDWPLFDWLDMVLWRTSLLWMGCVRDDVHRFYCEEIDSAEHILLGCIAIADKSILGRMFGF